MATRAIKNHTLTCHHCGGEFEAARSHAKYCCTTCRVNAFKARQSSNVSGNVIRLPVKRATTPESLATFSTLASENEQLRTIIDQQAQMIDLLSKMLSKLQPSMTAMQPAQKPLSGMKPAALDLDMPALQVKKSQTDGKTATTNFLASLAALQA